MATLLDLDRSYLAVQGPPGTGKTYVGSHVIAQLVQEHGWRVGVVGQSHAVVENMLDAVIEAGLDPSLVAKVENRSGGDWVTFGKGNIKKYVAYAAEHAGSGHVFGGTAWNLTNHVMVPGGLDLLFIDEAGQFSLAATLAVSVSAQRLLLLGDPSSCPR